MLRGILRYAFLNSFLTALYVYLVANFIFFLDTLSPGHVSSVFIPVAMLMLLVFSVAVVGSLIFGRSVMWYIDGKKKEAVVLLSYTLGILFLIIVLVFLVLVVWIV